MQAFQSAHRRLSCSNYVSSGDVHQARASRAGPLGRPQGARPAHTLTRAQSMTPMCSYNRSKSSFSSSINQFQLLAPALPSRRTAVVARASLTARVARIIRAYIGNAVSSLEQPELLLKQAVEDMQADLVAARQVTS